MRSRQLGLERGTRDVAAIKRAFDEPRPPSGRGGIRKNAGRKPLGAKAGLPHGVRPFLSPRHPVHIVLRLSPAVGRLRRRTAYLAIRRALITSLVRADFRVVHVSIQARHVHLICEADDRIALANGVRGLSISAARRLNLAVRRRGRVFVDRYHATAIASAKQSRSELAYVLNNWRHHREDQAGAAQRHARVDPYSSGIAFAGWSGREGIPFVWPRGYAPLPVSYPTTWLLTTGWRRWGPIALDAVPGR